MSVTIDSTNPRVIADNIRKLDDAVQAAASELPEVETTDEGKVLTVNASGKWAVLDLPASIPKDYSLTETDTGLKWIDGKNIYSKTFYFEAVTAPVDVEFTLEYIISANGFSFNTDRVVPIEVYNINNYQANIYYMRTSNTIRFGFQSNLVGDSAYVTLFYTKPDPAPGTREPDDAPDAESELKKVTKKKTTKKEEE